MAMTVDMHDHIRLHLPLRIRGHPKLGTANTRTPAQRQTVKSTLLGTVTRAMSSQGCGFAGEPHKAKSTVSVGFCDPQSRRPFI